jgi:hypothetical protein
MYDICISETLLHCALCIVEEEEEEEKEEEEKGRGGF